MQAFAEVKTVCLRVGDRIDALFSLQELAAVEQSINELNEGCAAILARIHSARETTASLVAQTNELQAQKCGFDYVRCDFMFVSCRATARAHCEIATAFLQRFQLTAEETKALE